MTETSDLNGTRSQSRSFDVLFWLVLIAVIVISFWQSSASQYLNFQNPKIDIVNLQRVDVDYHMLYPSIEAKHSFGETFRWWIEPWRADEWVGAYWRPLTMQMWWLQGHTFGEDRSFAWMRVSLFLALCFNLLLVGFIWQLTKNRWLALGALALFALPPEWWHAITPLSALPRVANMDLMIVQGWKDQPDLWANCFVLAAMIFALRERWLGVLICTAIAIAFKESGLFAFPLVAVLITANGAWKRVPVWLYAASIAMLALMMFARWKAGPLVFHFHSYGSDKGGLTRYLNAMTPLGLSALSSFGLALAGAGVFAIWLWRPKNLIVALLSLIAIFACAVGLVALQNHLTLDIAFAQLLLGWAPILLLLAWLVLTWTLWKHKLLLKWAMVCALCGFIAALPFALATQAAVHTLALAEGLLAGYAICLVAAIAETVRAIVLRGKSQQADPALIRY